MSQENPRCSSLSEAEWPENLPSVCGGTAGARPDSMAPKTGEPMSGSRRRYASQVKQKEQIFPHLFFRPMLYHMLDLSSPTRNQTCIGRMES